MGRLMFFCYFQVLKWFKNANLKSTHVKKFSGGGPMDPLVVLNPQFLY